MNIKKSVIPALAAALLTGCGYYGATHAIMAGMNAAAGLGYSAVGGIGGIADKVTETFTGEPASCSEQFGQHGLECEKGVDAAALTIARGNPDPRYLLLADGVAKCNSGKLPDPPMEEAHCGEYSSLKLQIDERVVELENSGKV